MKKLIVRFVVLAGLFAATMSVPRATTFVCPGSLGDQCQNVSSCDGDAFQRAAACKVQCMNSMGDSQYTNGGSCDCGPAKTTGGGGPDTGDGGGGGGICSIYPDACEEV